VSDIVDLYQSGLPPKRVANIMNRNCFGPLALTLSFVLSEVKRPLQNYGRSIIRLRRVLVQRRL